MVTHAQKREWKKGFLEAVEQYHSLDDAVSTGWFNDYLDAHQVTDITIDGKTGFNLKWMEPPSDTCMVHGKVRSKTRPQTWYNFRVELRRVDEPVVRYKQVRYGVSNIAEDIKGAEHEEAQYWIRYGWKSKVKRISSSGRPEYYLLPTHSQIAVMIGLQRDLPRFSEEETGMSIRLLDYYPDIEDGVKEEVTQLWNEMVRKQMKAKDRILKLYEHVHKINMERLRRAEEPIRWFNTKALLTRLI